jgi:gluconokinase
VTRVVALDVGTSSVRAVAFDASGEAEPGDAHLGYDSLDADALVGRCRAVLAQVGDGDLLALTSFWHSLLPLDEHDRPLTHVLTWQELDAQPPALDSLAYHERTGAFLHPSFWPAKILGLRDRARVARYVSFPDYLLLKLTGELRTSISMASGTGLYDPNALTWDGETLAALDLHAAQLPPVSEEPVAGVLPALGDGACSNVGAGCLDRGRAAVMIGTSATARVVFAAARADPRPGLFLYRLDRERFCEGGALSDGGNLAVWLRQTLRDLDLDGIADRPAAAHGLVFLPFLGGERSLGWNASRRGLVQGLTFETTPLDLAQAGLEAVCYRLADILDALGGIESLVATGGGLLGNLDWVQILADVVGRPVELSAVSEGSARGAAVVALERAGMIVPVAATVGVVEPREGRTEIHRAAREEQRAMMRLEEES